MAEDAPLFPESAIDEAARVLADLLHADEPGTAYDLALAVLNSAGVRHEVEQASLALDEALAALSVAAKVVGEVWDRGVGRVLRGGTLVTSGTDEAVNLGFLSLPPGVQDAVNAKPPHPDACPECKGYGTFAHAPDEPARAFHYRGCSHLTDGGERGSLPSDRHSEGVLRSSGPAAAVSHPEDYCGSCGRRNLPWTAPSPLWDAVMRREGSPEPYGGVVCPSCFMVLAVRAGVAPRGWRLYVTIDAGISSTSPDGRVWNNRTWLWEEADA